MSVVPADAEHESIVYTTMGKFTVMSRPADIDLEEPHPLRHFYDRAKESSWVPATFFLATLAALELEGVRLEDL